MSQPRRYRPLQPGVQQQLVELPLSDIIPDPDNPRSELTGIEELAESIRANGVIQPIIVRRTIRGQNVVVAGHRRLAALQLLGAKMTTVLVRRDMHPVETMSRMLVENGQRAGLDPIEEALAMRDLMEEHKLSQKEMARRIGRSSLYVSHRLSLLTLSPAQQEEVRAQQITLTEAVQRAKLTNPRAFTKKRADSATETGATPKPVGRGWHFDFTHPLAAQVKTACHDAGHKGRRVNGGVGCGECWEAAIRQDAVSAVLAQQQEIDATLPVA